MTDDIVSQAREKMQKAVSVLKDDLSTIRTGRATPALVENVEAKVYEGTQTLTIKELATITTDGPRSLIISPFDPSVISEIEKAINSANLGFSAIVDENIIRIKIPPLTQERREEFLKLAGAKIEGGRIMVRQIRQEAMSKIKKLFEEKEISEDEKFRLEKEVQKATDQTIEEIEKLRQRKEKELREV